MSLKTDIELHIDSIPTRDFERVRDWIDEGLYENPGRFAGMSFERGMETILDWLSGELTTDEVCESRD